MANNIVFWNVRGLNSHIKQREIALFCSRNKVGMVSLLETKLRSNKLGKCKRRFFHPWKSIDNGHCHPTARVWLLWREEEYLVTPLLMHSQYIHMKVHSKAFHQDFFVTAIYASNDAQHQLLLWDEMRNMSVQGAWLLAGDFNNVLRP